MDIEAIVKKHWKGTMCTFRSDVVAALTELAQGYEQRLKFMKDNSDRIQQEMIARFNAAQERIRQLSETLAIEQRACNKLAHDHGFLLAEREALQERIRQLEAERVPDGCIAVSRQLISDAIDRANYSITGWEAHVSALTDALASAPQQKKEGE